VFALTTETVGYVPRPVILVEPGQNVHCEFKVRAEVKSRKTAGRVNSFIVLIAAPFKEVSCKLLTSD
jgi:hypothetical protein